MDRQRRSIRFMRHDRPPKDLALASSPLAPAAHTITLLVFLFVLAAYGVIYGPLTSASPTTPYTVRSLLSIIQRLTLLGAVVGGVYHRRAFLQDALFHRARSWTNEFGMGIIVCFAGMIASISATMTGHLLHRPPHLLSVILPHAATQLPIWFLVSLVTGVGEEIIFRGYLLRQFTAWSGRGSIAITAVSLMFGAIHLYQGLPNVVALTLVSAIYCVVTLCRGNVRAVIIAHTLMDFFSCFPVLSMPPVERLQHLHFGL
jgi:membrane protease YdiL (CAAX protease family)